MQIRCESCATLYRLDDSLLPPRGAPVQCTRCGHLFVAMPPAAGTPVIGPIPHAAPHSPPEAAPAPVAPEAQPADAGGESELIAFERGLARNRTIVIGAVVGLLGVSVVTALGIVIARQFGRSFHDPAAVERLDGLLAAVRTGDPAKALATAPFAEEALAIEPELRRARADRGLALLVAAGEQKDLADRAAARRPAIERALRKAEEAADAQAAEELRRQLEALKGEYDPLLAAYGKLKAEADSAIEGAYKGGGEEDAAAVRAMGMLRAAGGDEKNAPILAENYRKLAGDADGWAELIEGSLLASGRASPEKRTQAVEKLTAALAKDASFGIAHLLLGRVRLDLLDFAGARQELGRALVASPANELAKRWLADVDAAHVAATSPTVGGEATGANPASTTAATPGSPPPAG